MTRGRDANNARDVKNRISKNPAIVGNDSTQSAFLSTRTSEPGLLWIGDVYFSREWSGEMGRALNSYQKVHFSANGQWECPEFWMERGNRQWDYNGVSRLATYSKYRIYTNLSVHHPPYTVFGRIIKDNLGRGISRGDFHARDNMSFIVAENWES